MGTACAWLPLRSAPSGRTVKGPWRAWRSCCGRGSSHHHRSAGQRVQGVLPSGGDWTPKADAVNSSVGDKAGRRWMIRALPGRMPWSRCCALRKERTVVQSVITPKRESHPAHNGEHDRFARQGSSVCGHRAAPSDQPGCSWDSCRIACLACCHSVSSSSMLCPLRSPPRAASTLEKRSRNR